MELDQQVKKDLTKSSTTESTTNTEKEIRAADYVGGKTLEDLRREQNGKPGKEKKAQTDEERRRLIDYKKKIFEAENDKMEITVQDILNAEKRPHKIPAQVMSYDKARRSVWYIAKGKAEAQGIKLEIDKANKALFQNLTKYFISDPSGEYDLMKGIFLFGPTGTGKTFVMEIFKRLCDAHRIEFRQFKQVLCSSIYESAQAAQSTSGLSLYQNGNYFFDDLGDEPANLKLYGNDINVMGSILTKRADRFSVGHCLTFVTSNLEKSELEQRYGTRIASRASQMFNFVFVDGPDRRK